MTGDAPNVPAVQGAREARYAEAIKGHAWHDYDGECACGWFPTEGQRGSSVDLWAGHIAPLLAPLVDAEVAAAVSEAQAERDKWLRISEDTARAFATTEREAGFLRAEVERLREGIRGWIDEAPANTAGLDLLAQIVAAPSPSATTGEAASAHVPHHDSGCPLTVDPESDCACWPPAPVSSGEAGTGEAAKPEWWDADHDRPADVYTPPERTYCRVCGVGYTLHVDSLCKRSESRGIRSPRPAPVVTPSAEGSE